MSVSKREPPEPKQVEFLQKRKRFFYFFFLGQFEYLRHVMIQLSGVPDLWQVDCIQNMWKSVLLMPLTAAVPPLSDDQVVACLQSATLLHRF